MGLTPFGKFVMKWNRLQILEVRQQAHRYHTELGEECKGVGRKRSSITRSARRSGRMIFLSGTGVNEVPFVKCCTRLYLLVQIFLYECQFLLALTTNNIAFSKGFTLSIWFFNPIFRIWMIMETIRTIKIRPFEIRDLVI